MNLKENLDKWVNANIITDKQKDEIIYFENKDNNVSNRLFYSLTSFGCFLSTMGIGLFIFSNWYYLGDISKIVMGFLSLLLIAFSYTKGRCRTDFMKDALLFLFCCFCFLYQMLIKDIFYINLYFNQMVLLFMGISFPLIFLAKGSFFPFVWIGGFLSSLIIEFFRNGVIKNAYDILFLGISGTDKALLIIAFISVIWLLIETKNGTIKSVVNFYAFVIIMGIVFPEDILSNNRLFKFYDYSSFGNHYFVIALFLLSSILGLIIYFKDLKLLRIPYIGFLSLIIISAIENHLNMALPFFFTLWNFLIMFYFVIYGVVNNKGAFFNFGILIIGFRFVIYFIMIANNMMFNGISMILSGVFIVFIMLLFNKYRQKLWVKLDKCFSPSFKKDVTTDITNEIGMR